MGIFFTATLGLLVTYGLLLRQAGMRLNGQGTENVMKVEVEVLVEARARHNAR